MKKEQNLTEGKILGSLIKFAIPVIFALFLQAMYGAVDLLVVGQFAETADVSGVASGSLLMQTITCVITGFAMGITVLVGQKIGEKKPEEASKAVGGGICLFTVFALVLTAALVVFAGEIAKLLHAPEEAFDQTVMYIRICGAGSIFIVAYNVLGSIFRGIGDSKMPLITVGIACVINIVCDLLFVAVFHWGTMGAALATVLAQAVSVLISFLIIKRKTIPFKFTRKDIRFHKTVVVRLIKIGAPVALQEMLVGISFLVVQTIVNAINVSASAGLGIAEKVCMFIMLVPSAYLQAMSAFVAQNMGAGKPKRAKKALFYGIVTSVSIGLVMACFSFFRGDLLSSIFTKDALVIAEGHSYMKAYAIDSILTPFLFCFVGYYNGCEKTMFVMLQGIIGAFCVRIPIVYFVSKIPEVTLFQIGLGTPASTLVQIILCLGVYFWMGRKEKKNLKINT